MKKFRLTMFIGNCENFGTEWEELRKEVKIVEAKSKEDVENKYSSNIYDCDCKSYYIEELGVPCFKIMIGDKCYGQYDELEDATREFSYLIYDLKESVGKIRIEIGIRE